MKDHEIFMDVMNKNSFQAEIMCSLAVAADLIIRCESLTNKDDAKKIGLHLIESMKFISESMKFEMTKIAEEKEKVILRIKRERGLC